MLLNVLYNSTIVFTTDAPHNESSDLCKTRAVEVPYLPGHEHDPHTIT